MTIVSSKHPQYYLYTAWFNLMARCHKPHNPYYKNYGARGITVYQAWHGSHEEFVEYVLSTIGERPSSSHTLDRIENDKGYEPGNLKWSTRSEQNLNTRTSRDIPYVYAKPGNKWAVSIKGIYYGRRDSQAEAIVLRDEILKSRP